MTAESWSPGEELVALLRRWHWFSAAALLGGLAGWLLGLVLPPVYEAEAVLSVTFTADAFSLNSDDYKHWQMAQLEDYILSEPVLEDARTRLAPASTLTVRDLRAAVEPRWRNAGAWQLVARAEDPAQAEVIARAWSEAALAGIEETLAHAADFNELDRRLTARARELEDVRAHLDALGLLRQDIEAWLRAPESEGGEAGAVFLAGRLAALLAGTGTAPAGDLLESDPAAWLASAAAALEAEIGFQEARLARLHADYDTLGDDWLEARRRSQGFSAYLLVEPRDGGEVATVRVYESASLSLAGAAVGFFGLIGFRLIAVIRKERDGDRPD